MRLGYYLAIRQLVGEAHDQYVDDTFATSDGSLDLERGVVEDVGLVPVAAPGRAKIHRLPHVGDRPYWATNGPDASQCRVSIAGDDRVNIYEYGTHKKVGSVRVGDHPQRVRVGHVSEAALTN